MSAHATDTPARREFYDRISTQNLAPLWTSMANLVTPEPKSPCQPAAWRFADIRAAMIEAGGLITAKEAERRVLVLENPGLRGQSKITTDLYAGVQLVLPGEVAPAHRHSQTALRFVLEGEGAHTVVNGERTIMHEGDFIITPPMAWHDHGNESANPIFWLDGLDIPVVQFLDASFAEHMGEDAQPITRKPDDSDARYGANLLPVDSKRRGTSSPIFNYPYARTREALERMKLQEEWDACHGLKMRYINPETGGHATADDGHLHPAAAARASRPRPTARPTRRCTRAVEGHGRSHIGEDFTVEWGPRDVFVVPSWHRVRHEADADCGAVLLLGPADAGGARPVPRGSREMLRRVALALHPAGRPGLGGYPRQRRQDRRAERHDRPVRRPLRQGLGDRRANGRGRLRQIGRPERTAGRNPQRRPPEQGRYRRRDRPPMGRPRTAWTRWSTCRTPPSRSRSTR